MSKEEAPEEIWSHSFGSGKGIKYVRSDICAALVEALERLADAYFTFGEALVELPNQPLLPKAVEAEYSALIDAAFAARTAIAQAREEGRIRETVGR